MKQVIAVRSDLKLPKGKLAAQVAHAAVEAVFNSSQDKVEAWASEGMKKVVLKVEDLKQLQEYQQFAKQEKLVASLITDAGKTFFGTSTTTCLGIGADEEDVIDKVTAKLKMI